MSPRIAPRSGRARGIDWVVTGTAAALVSRRGLGLLGRSPANFASQALTTSWSIGWLFVLADRVRLFVLSWLSKFGHIKLGKDGEQPEFSTFSWVAMMSPPVWASA